MILFVIYTGAVWLMCFAQRRRPLGFLLAALSALPLAGLGFWLNRHHDTLTVWALAVFVFAGLVGLIALFLSVQPRRPAHACDACGYDLHGVISRVCPECGNGATPHHAPNVQAAAMSPDQAAALRARRARTTWSATDMPTTRTIPTTAATPADVHADVS